MWSSGRDGDHQEGSSQQWSSNIHPSPSCLPYEAWERPSDIYAPIQTTTTTNYASSSNLGYESFLNSYNNRQQSDNEIFNQSPSADPWPETDEWEKISRDNCVKLVKKPSEVFPITSQKLPGNWLQIDSDNCTKLVKKSSKKSSKSPGTMSTTKHTVRISHEDFWGTGDTADQPTTSSSTTPQKNCVKWETNVDSDSSNEDSSWNKWTNPYDAVDNEVADLKNNRPVTSSSTSSPDFSESSDVFQASSTQVDELEESLQNLGLKKTSNPSTSSFSEWKSGKTPGSPMKTPKSEPKLATYWSTPVPRRLNAPSAPYLPNLGILMNSEAPMEDLEGNEKKEKEEVNPGYLSRLRFLEEERNAFSPLYQGYEPKKGHGKKSHGKTPKSYKHSDAITFAAMSYTWKDNWDKDLPKLPRHPNLIMPLPNSILKDSEVCAFYRVLAEKDQKYILIACHVNLHGFHRGDLRFLEVNDRTRLKGLEGKNVIGNLFLGDVVAVTELVRNSSGGSKLDTPVSAVSQDTPCLWVVSQMALFPRRQPFLVTFSFLKNRMAVVKGYDEPMRVTVDDWTEVRQDLIYTGTAFSPTKMENCFTEDFDKKRKNQIISRVLKISSYPNAFGTIYTFNSSEDYNEQFTIGVDAFSPSSKLNIEERENIVETCSLMGFSAANTIFNGRFDCRAFHMEDIRKQGNMLKFCIDNPPNQPTLGLWNAGNRIMFGGPHGDVNGAIETVIEDPCTGCLRITARLSRDPRVSPKGLNFQDGEFFVSQREITDQYTLIDGYFRHLEAGCNGRRIIETLYGAEPLEQVKPGKAKDLVPTQSELLKTGPTQFYFPSTPEPLALNTYQCEYVQMLLDGNPLIIGSSPFGCGKSMTIITAALEIYKRNCEEDELRNQRQQLLITQSNYASVNLIEIAKRVCLTGDPNLMNLKFVRFVSEKNWNELPDNCRTEYDMPYLMNQVFMGWATGQLPDLARKSRRLQSNHTTNMLAYILKNELVDPANLVGQARQVYDRLGELKTPFPFALIEAFFVLYQPDLVMTTADSSKSLLGLLQSVCTVQIDEASQLPEYTLLGLLKSFNQANFGLIGDIHQLPPYCEDNLEGRLKEYGIGNTMERAIQGNLFPKSVLRYVYRCHPRTTELLSELFYDRALISGVSEDERNSFIKSRPNFWPNPHFPFMIVNNTGSSYKMGTSTGNDTEKQFVGKLIANLLNCTNAPVKAQDIGVISFYTAQTSILTEHLRGSGVKCGTVDAFQGTEKEIIILCCTNERISEFMQLSNRLNVAMSRAKQATIIVGNMEGLRRAKYWSTIVERVEVAGNVMQVSHLNQPPRPLQQQQLQLLRSIQQQKQQPQQQQQQQQVQQPVDNVSTTMQNVKKSKSKKRLTKMQEPPVPNYNNNNGYFDNQRQQQQQQQQQQQVGMMNVAQNALNPHFRGRWDENTYSYSRNPSYQYN